MNIKEILRQQYLQLPGSRYCYGKDCDDNHCRCEDYWIDEQMEKMSAIDKSLLWLVDRISAVHSKVKMFIFFKTLKKKKAVKN